MPAIGININAKT